MTRRTYLIAALAVAAWLPTDDRPSQSVAVAQRGDSDRRDDDDDENRGERRRRWRRDRDEDNDSDRGRESERESSNSNSSTPPTAATAGGASAGLGMRNYAKSLIAQNDKDGDRMLKGDELSGLRGKTAKADGNNDGVITLDEMIAALSSKEPAAPVRESKNDGDTPPSDPPQSASAVQDGTGTRKLTNGERKSFRFKPAKERLPGGLPSFFSRDANGDGQIAMHEYSRS